MLFGLAKSVWGNSQPVNTEQMTQEIGTCWGAGSCLACQWLGYLQPGSAAGSKGAKGFRWQLCTLQQHDSREGNLGCHPPLYPSRSGAQSTPPPPQLSPEPAG